MENVYTPTCPTCADITQSGSGYGLRSRDRQAGAILTCTSGHRFTVKVEIERSGDVITTTEAIAPSN